MKVRIKNYQAIKDATLEFSKGINAIVGKTNAGKSSIIRALEATINNKAGNSFINYDAKECSVEITTDTGDIIVWTKPTRGSATYEINGEVFSKIGRTQDDDVASILNMPEIAVGTNKIRLNFWKQMEYPFLVGYSSGQLFEFISKSPEQEYIKYLQELKLGEVTETKKDIDSGNTKIDLRKTDITNLELAQVDLKKFIDFDLDLLETLYNADNSLKEKLATYNETNIKLSEYKKDLLKYYDKINGLTKVTEELEPLIKKVNELDEHITNFNLKTKRVEELKPTVKNNETKIKDLEVKVGKVETTINDIKTHTDTLVRLKDSMGNINTLNDKIKALKEKLECFEKDIENTQKELDEFTVCPMCQQPLDSSHKH